MEFEYKTKVRCVSLCLWEIIKGEVSEEEANEALVVLLGVEYNDFLKYVIPSSGNDWNGNLEVVSLEDYRVLLEQGCGGYVEHSIHSDITSAKSTATLLTDVWRVYCQLLKLKEVEEEEPTVDKIAPVHMNSFSNIKEVVETYSEFDEVKDFVYIQLIDGKDRSKAWNVGATLSTIDNGSLYISVSHPNLKLEEYDRN